MLERMQDKSSKLRSRGMSGLEQLIQKDPRVIQEGHVKNMVTNFNDPSPMVRESTLSLVSTCLEHQPSLQPHFLPYILRLTTDPSNGPKKKAIKLLRDVYNGHCSKEDKLNIIASLLQPSQDDEKAIAELAGNILEEILLATTKYNANSNETQLKLRRAKRSTLIIETIQHIRSEPRYLEAFEKLFIHVLSPEAKTLDANSAVCKDLVADMIDEVISSESGDANFQARIMIALSIFAKVRPTLFTVDQIQLLKLYIKDIATTEDLALVQPTVVVFRYVFATLSSLQAAFAEEVRAGLMRIISKLASWAAQGRTEARDTLIDIAHCLWTITPMVEQGASKLCTSIISILCQLRPLAFCTKEQAFSKRGKITPYIILLGTFGKVCNFDQHIEVFRERLALTARSTVDKKLATPQQMEPYLMSNSTAALLLLEAVRPFTMQTWDMSIRAQALQSVGGICQGSPNLFMRAEIEKIFKLVFINTDNDQLRRIALVAFNEYFNFAERRSDTGAEIAVGKGAATGNARLETSFIANENDSATLHIAQRFLQNFVDTALKHNNVLAHLATNIVASISRQGLVHPKECGAALVALCTSPNEAIAQVAAVEHKRIHEKQESYLEKEYMQAIRMAFKYQSEVFNDPHGMRQVTHSAKLARLFEALKSGKKATFKKFINNMCKQIDFNFAKLDATGDTPEPVLFARFCLENLALLDFSHLEELALCLNALEAIVLKTTGPIVALAIETEMPKRFVAMEQHPGPDMHQHPLGDAAVVETPPVSSQLAQPNISDARLREITAACMILKMVWETRIFVRRCFNMQKLKGRIPQKDYIKPAQRNNFVSGKELWETLAPIMNALDTRDAMLRACYEFADILEVDREAEIEEGEDSAVGTGYETPTEGDDSVPFPTSGRGRKRKSNVSLSNTPKKQRGRPAGARKKRNSKTPDFDDDED
jgi:cohesin loading factor subunit SCC2